MYNKLNKEEKKTIRNKYARTKRGTTLLKMYRRIFLDGIVCFLCAVGIQIGIIFGPLPKWYGILTIVLVVMTLVFIISQHILKIKEYNKFMEQSKK